MEGNYNTCGEITDSYQEQAMKTKVYHLNKGDSKIDNLMYVALGLCGESGEVAEKVKKIFRNYGGEINEDNKAALVRELGDVLWYVAALASELGVKLSVVADLNLSKLSDRSKRSVIASEGDNR